MQNNKRSRGSKRSRKNDKDLDEIIEDTNEELAPVTSRKEHRKGKKAFNNWQAIFLTLLKVLVILVLSVVLVVVAYGAKILSSADQAIDDAFTPVKRETSINDGIDPIKDPIAILILGIDDNDERDLGTARTDAMILATVSPTTNKISMVSIPRDTYTQINSAEFVGKDKINAAYTYGNVEATIDAVETLMNVPINYYLTLDFSAFEKVVDAVGGVTMDVDFDYLEQDKDANFVVQLEKGRHLLDGQKALAFARTRKVDNDVMRGSRQQQVMEAVLTKAMNVGSVTKFQSIINAIKGHFWTDLETDTMLKIVESGLKNKYSFESYIFEWQSFDYPIFYGMSNFVALNQDSLDYISHRLRLSLDLDVKDERDEPGFELQTNGIVDPDTYPQDGLAVLN